MAFRVVLIVSIVAVASGFVWDNNVFNPFAVPNPALQMLNSMYSNSNPRAPAAPRQPFPFGVRMPFMPRVISPDEIINAKPGPDQVFSGIVAKSSSGITRDKDGNIVKTGGTVVVTNDNGDVKQYTSGSNPPDIKKPIVLPQIRI